MSYAKTAIYPNSLILEGEGSSFLRKKRKDEELTIWTGGTSSSRRQWRWWRQQLDFLDEAMAKV
jgi:hypothetical protein